MRFGCAATAPLSLGRPASREDVGDTRTNRVVWRGWAQDAIDGVIDNQDSLRTEVNKAVTRMMALLPRHL